MALPTTHRSIVVVGIGGDRTIAYQSEAVLLEVEGIILPVHFWVGPNEEGTILGIDLLGELGAVVDAFNKRLLWTARKEHKSGIQGYWVPNKNVAAIGMGAPAPTARDWKKEGLVGLLCQALPQVWATGKQDCGLVTILPLQIQGPAHAPHKQYPIKPEALQATETIVQALVKRGILRPTVSHTNSPMWPVRKPDGNYRLTIDYTALNKVTPKEHPIVASPATIFNGLRPEYCIFSVLDIANGFWSIPLHPDSQEKFAFTCGGRQYTWTRLPQGFHNSPNIFHRVMSKALENCNLSPYESAFLQYVDDILIASTNPTGHLGALSVILRGLQTAGFKVNPTKAQLAKPEVRYLGHYISQGKKTLPTDRKTAIANMTRPNTVRGVRRVMGLFNYCRNFIDQFASIAEPIQRLVKGGRPGAEIIEWGPEQETAYSHLKSELLAAPALCLPNIAKPFHLFYNAEDGFYSSVVTQESGGTMRPVAYYSVRQSPIAKGLHKCVAALDCAAWAVRVCEPITMLGQIILHTKHTIVELLNTGRLRTVSDARRAAWEAVLLPQDQSIKIVRDTGRNPAEGFLPDGSPHHCPINPDMDTEDGISDQPLENPDIILYVDGSRRQVEGQYRTGWAVVDQEGTLIAKGTMGGGDLCSSGRAYSINKGP